MKVHLIGGVLNTVCGKPSDEVYCTARDEAVTCKSCLRISASRKLKKQDNP